MLFEKPNMKMQMIANVGVRQKRDVILMGEFSNDQMHTLLILTVSKRHRPASL